MSAFNAQSLTPSTVGWPLGIDGLGWDIMDKVVRDFA
jgi:hypothetical protein